MRWALKYKFEEIQAICYCNIGKIICDERNYVLTIFSTSELSVYKWNY